MNSLEMILEELEKAAENADYQSQKLQENSSYQEGIARGLYFAARVVRKHMNKNNRIRKR